MKITATRFEAIYPVLKIKKHAMLNGVHVCDKAE